MQCFIAGGRSTTDLNDFRYDADTGVYYSVLSGTYRLSMCYLSISPVAPCVVSGHCSVQFVWTVRVGWILGWIQIFTDQRLFARYASIISAYARSHQCTTPPRVQQGLRRPLAYVVASMFPKQKRVKGVSGLCYQGPSNANACIPRHDAS